MHARSRGRAHAAGQVGRAFGVDAAGAGIGLRQRVADRAHGRLRVARVVPPVGVIARGLWALALALPPAGTRAPRSTIAGSPPACSTTFAHPAVEVVAVEQGPRPRGPSPARRRAGARSRGDRCWASAAGTTFGSDRRPGRAKSPICVVAATTLAWPGAGRPLRRAPGRAGASGGGGQRGARPRGVAARTRAGAARGEDAAGEHGDRGPRRRDDLDRQPQPGRPPRPQRAATGRELPGPQAASRQPGGGGRDDEQGGGQQSAEGRQGGDARRARPARAARCRAAPSEPEGAR